MQSSRQQNLYILNTQQKKKEKNKYLSLKYLSSQIALPTYHNNEISMQCIRRSKGELGEGESEKEKKNDRVMAAKLHLLLQPAFGEKSEIQIQRQKSKKIIQHNQHLNNTKYKGQNNPGMETNQHCKQIRKRIKTENDGKERANSSNKIEQILTEFLESKINTARSVYVDSNQSHAIRKKKISTIKCKEKMKEQNKLQNVFINQVEKQQIQIQRYRTQHDHDILIYDGPSNDEDQYCNEEMMAQYKIKTKPIKNRYKSLSYHEKIKENTKSNCYSTINNEKNMRYESKQGKLNQPVSIARRNCLYFSSYMRIKSKISINEQQNTHKTLENKVQPHIGGSNGIIKCAHNKQYYEKLKLENMKRRNIINHYSKAAKANSNKAQMKVKVKSKQNKNANLGEIMRPTISINPW